LSIFKKCKKYIAIAAVSASIGMSYVLITDNKPNAYEVCVGDKVIAYVSQDKDTFNFVKALGEEVEKKFGSSELKNKLIINKAQVDGSFLSDKEALKKAVFTSASVEVDSFAIAVDKKEIAIVGSEAEGKQVLDKLKDYYASKSGMTVKESKIKNNITYVKRKSALSDIGDIDKVVETIIEANAKAKDAIVIVELKGTVESTQTIEPPTTITWSQDMLVGQSKLQSSGKEGEKLVVKEVVMENGKTVSSKPISEKVITKAQEKIIVQGKKSASVIKNVALTSPSRGTVSSNFGMRWGKMHEGMDIAAAIGEPIYAAMAGTVTYAGWQSGYGNFILLKHPGGLETGYGHCSAINVKVGETVKMGEKIGEVGNTGNSTGPHLHFEVRVNGVAKNPVAYLK
jgi:murein DD-endopeptidase MepM/ murein hydrolase activator NlpD